MSVLFDLSRKLEWMSRRLRWIDDVAEIREWVDAMSALNKMIMEVPREPEKFTDGWKPYKERKEKVHAADDGKTTVDGLIDIETDVDPKAAKDIDQHHVKDAAKKRTGFAKSRSRLKKLTTKISNKKREPQASRQKLTNDSTQHHGYTKERDTKPVGSVPMASEEDLNKKISVKQPEEREVESLAAGKKTTDIFGSQLPTVERRFELNEKEIPASREVANMFKSLKKGMTEL